MGSFDWVELDGKRRVLSGLASSLMGRSIGTSTHNDYQFAVELLKRMHDGSYSPRGVGEVSSGRIACFGTFLSSSFHKFFINRRITDEQSSTYMHGVFCALEEPYRASKEQKEHAGRLISVLSEAVSAEMRKINPEGNI